MQAATQTKMKYNNLILQVQNMKDSRKQNPEVYKSAITKAETKF